MRPSKQNARLALEKLERLTPDNLKFIEEFLRAAEKRLPNEDALIRDGQRGTRPRKAKKVESKE